MATALSYGNWIRRKNLLLLGLGAVAAGVLALIPLGLAYRLSMTFVFIVILASFLFPLYAYVMFSQRGGGFQAKVYGLIIQSLGANVKGRFLDIGSGNGVLAVLLAQQHGEAEVVGIDYWGPDWEYSRAVCEKNARAAGVEGRVGFQHGDAASLEFAGEAFDGAVSNLTFHEVRSAADKRAVVREALRVVKPGGTFAFVDYFYDEKYYGPAPAFKSYLSDLGLAQFECRPIRDVLAVPLLLRHPKALGKVGIIRGRK